jgi:hypothetical protein
MPNRFVLKATHGSGWNVFCKDRQSFDWEKAQRRLREWLKQDFYHIGFEWPYHCVPPRIVAEHFLKDPDHEDLLDYKIFCFDGKPSMIQVDVDRFSNHTRAMFDTEWRQLPFSLAYPCPSVNVAQPSNLPEMLCLAEALSRDLPFVRVDLYSVQGTIYFGEMTMFPGAGYERFEPGEWDKRLGDMLRLPR